MARDAGLEELVHGDLPEEPFTEKAMFGGWAWLLRGHLVCAARDAGLLVRLGKGNAAWALARGDIVPMISRGRRMEGWVRAGPAAYGDDALRRRLLEEAVTFVRGLPAK